MTITSAQMAAAIEKAYTNAGRLDNIVNGSATTDVPVDSGVVPSVAKFFAGVEADVDALVDAAVSSLSSAFAVLLNTPATGATDTYTLLTPVSSVNGHLNINVQVGGVPQPKDGAAYTVINSGTQIKFSEVPAAGLQLYAEGAAVYNGTTSVVVEAGATYLFPNKAAAQVTTIDAAITAIQLAASVTSGDGLGGVYSSSNNGSTDTFTTNGGARTWYRVDPGIDRLAPLKLYGAASLARSQQARFGDTVNLRDWFDRTGSDGSATANNAALTALIAYLNSNPQVRTLEGNKGDVYRTTAIDQVLPAGIRLMMNGAKFRWSGTIGGTASQFLTVNSGSHVEGLGLDVVNASTFRRLITTEGDCRIFDWEVYAESQINNYGGSLLDWAIRVYRHNNKVRGLKVSNIDRAVFAYGADGDGVPGLNNTFLDVEAYNYVTGFCLRNLVGAINRGYRCSGRSVNGTDDPGMNGLLHEGVAEYLLVDFIIRDASEHGLRFGGTRNAEQASKHITVGNGGIFRSGQSGFKMFTGTAGQKFLHVNVSNINVVDCQYEPAAPAELPGFNDEGFLLQQIQHGVFSGLKVTKQDSITGFSCMDGVYVSGSDNLLIQGLYVDSPKRNALRISEFDGDTSPNSVEILANNEIMVRAMQAENVGEHGVYLDSPSQSLRDINIEAELIGNGAATFYALSTSAAAARFAQPCLFQYKQRNFAAGAHNLPATANVKTRDVYGATY